MTDNFDTLAKAERIAGNLPGLLLEADKVAHTFMKGLHGRRRVGQGETFWQFRQYEPGDQPRDIDWRQSAKRDDVFIRQREWEASQTAWLYRDATESMNYRGYKNLPTKKEFAEILLLATAIVILNGGEQVSLLGTNLAPQTTYNSIQRIFEYLPVQTHLAQTGRPVVSRSEVVLFSDFFYPLEQLTVFCESLARRNVKGSLVQVHCPSEKTLPFKGRMKFYDIEASGAPPITLPQVEAVREEYERKFIVHQESLRQAAESWGWRFMAADTSQKPEDVLGRLYNQLAVKKK
ncbi:MAG: DUF58 domain-containing protein [Alphaproteobacteria bacterium]